mmetsp:Transcript_2949/g.6143  ORF Transcript_2949/g.6143 Transcript_2949/m.6143 type:complete len:240 (+) Transcript_2949:612-1331(+)
MPRGGESAHHRSECQWPFRTVRALSPAPPHTSYRNHPTRRPHPTRLPHPAPRDRRLKPPPRGGAGGGARCPGRGRRGGARGRQVRGRRREEGPMRTPGGGGVRRRSPGGGGRLDTRKSGARRRQLPPQTCMRCVLVGTSGLPTPPVPTGRVPAEHRRPRRSDTSARPCGGEGRASLCQPRTLPMDTTGGGTPGRPIFRCSQECGSGSTPCLPMMISCYSWIIIVRRIHCVYAYMLCNAL